MKENWKIYKSHGLSLSAIAFSIPLWPQLTIALTALALVLSVRGLLNGLIGLFNNAELKWMLVLFALLISGLAWTSNIKLGLMEIKDELYILAMPLLFFSGNYSSADIRLAKNGLVAGSLIAILICMGWAFFSYLNSRDYTVFFYKSFSILLHPTNFAVVLALSALVTVDDLRRVPYQSRGWKKYVLLFLIFSTIVLVNSKGCFLACTLIFTLVLYISYRRKSFFLIEDGKLQLTVVLAVLLGALLISKFNRLDQVISASDTTVLQHRIKSIDVDSTLYNSTTIRMAHWNYSWLLFKSQPLLGSGTGDEVEDLCQIFKEKRDPYALKHFRHPHSYYLHYMIMLGIPGLLLSLIALIRPFTLAWSKGNWTLVLFCLMLFTLGFTDIITHSTLGTIFSFGMGLMVFEHKTNI